jgi:GDP-mannose 6-dehydrogenase
MISEGRAPIVEPGLDHLLKRIVDEGKLLATSDVQTAVSQTDLSLICVGTPSSPNGSLDLENLTRVCESIGHALNKKASYHSVVVRSTLLPGSMDKIVTPILEESSRKAGGRDFGLIYYPEFLREGSALKDYNQSKLILIGVQDENSERIARELVCALSGQVIVTNFITAEGTKYVNNAWHAAKIVFANEMGVFCKSQGIDSHAVMDLLCRDTRLNISSSYMKPGFAYGGSCLPKDLSALQYRARSADLELPMLNSLSVSNQLHIRRAFELIASTGKRKVGLVGLTFKAGTDDLRDSPAVELAEMLFGKGYQLKIFDHNVVLSKLNGVNLSFIQSRIPHLSCLMTEDFDSMLSFADTLVITTGDLGSNSLENVRSDQVVIDLTRLPERLRPSMGIYMGMCW